MRAVETLETISLCSGCAGFLPRDADCAKTVRAFEESGGKLRTASADLQANKAVVLAAVAKNGLSLEFATPLSKLTTMSPWLL